MFHNNFFFALWHVHLKKKIIKVLIYREWIPALNKPKFTSDTLPTNGDSPTEQAN